MNLLFLRFLFSSYAFFHVFCESAFAVDNAPFHVQIKEPHEVQVIDAGIPALQKRLEMIDRATQRISVEYFIFNTDQAGRIFTQALIRKKQSNPKVQIRVIVDASSTVLQLKGNYINELVRNGIEIRYYNPVFFLQFITMQYRDHRKLLAIDGREAITGGRNIADE